MFEKKGALGEMAANQREKSTRLQRFSDLVDRKFETHDLQFQRLVQAMAAGAGSAGSGLHGLDGGGGGAGSDANAVARRVLRPLFIDFKGWVTNWKDRETRKEDVPFVDHDRTERMNGERALYRSVKMAFKPGAESDVAWGLAQRTPS
eukprot:8713014-Pyramimonas_sp.AAC.1